MWGEEEKCEGGRGSAPLKRDRTLNIMQMIDDRLNLNLL